MRLLTKHAGWLVGWLLLALPAAAQYQFGEVQLTNLTGNIGAGYTGAYGNQQYSSHSLGLNGSAALNGFYYNPGFFSFSATPYYDESRANSNYRSVGDSSGVALSSSIFAGSHFPGSVNYTKAYDSSGTIALPGTPEITSHGNSDNLGLRWSEAVPDMPSLSAFYSLGHGSSSIYGINGMSDTKAQSVGLNSSYAVEGFHLTSNYLHTNTDGTIPPFLQAQEIKTSSSGDGYSFAVSHKLPFNGGISVGYNHSDFSANTEGALSNGTVNTSFGNLTFNPVSKLSLTATANYTDNLAGEINEAILGAGGIGPAIVTNSASHSFDLTGTGIYELPHGIALNGIVGRRDQTFLGQTYTSNLYGGGVSVTHVFLGGIINGMVRVVEFNTDAVGVVKATNSTSLITSLNYSRDVGLWRLAGNFSYAQNQQTLLISYLTSFYSYGGTVNRPIYRLRWSGSFSGNHSGIPAVSGTASDSESFSTSLGSRHLTGGGSYSRSNGNGVLTPLGVTPSPVPSPILTQLILYGGKSYSFTLGSSPISRLIVSGSYSVSMGDTTSPTLATSYHTKSLNTLVQYRFRQIGFTGGYSRLIQGFNLTGGPPFDASTFFVGVNRWFNFF